ncbi:hypothetical protein [Clavibacter nebraskensis]|uniref:Uncharacterized protein n=2 Tax=Clavibacter nebraskensis TaxID=31963 RepID=A0A399PX32_9MICO|nr:hypothetical protein [Clavibacter nebraskensis]KXU21651.1 hypothetical protein VV38_02085 [Clavibacter nebraskensis]OAH22550.1 hypothetical protein A3Q38_01135 [Clavibacter nebraskensis]QGV65795.1 hypothetical protein EGX36_02440 [Clavibacter nebraskensis]QGV68589.1 hypothetical protein EGX37_02425 [Clavibacter nebraskensis]RIJ11143.1 hypothetical protein DZF97_09120 [Clavibacter nebraskensis]
MNTADPTLDTRIAAFAAAVRARLADLDPEDVDDLTGGLEADLQEEAADHDGALELGDPARYADELRSSAGLPDRTVETAAASPLHQLRDGIRARAGELHARIRANRELSAILDLLIVFRPVWWLLRAWAGYQVLAFVVAGSFRVLPTDLTGWVALIVLTVISVQWGLGRWTRSRTARTLRTIASSVTAVALVVLIPSMLNELAARGYDDPGAAYSTPYEQPGLSLDGKQITNLFAYDAEGDLLDRVQLFDQDGEPLTTIGSYETDGTVSDPATGEPVTPADGAWNVFPLGGSDAALVTGTIDGSDAVVRPPFAKALPLDPDPEATSAPSPTAAPDASPPAETPAPEPAPAEEPTP